MPGFEATVALCKLSEFCCLHSDQLIANLIAKNLNINRVGMIAEFDAEIVKINRTQISLATVVTFGDGFWVRPKSTAGGQPPLLTGDLAPAVRTRLIPEQASAGDVLHVRTDSERSCRPLGMLLALRTASGQKHVVFGDGGMHAPNSCILHSLIDA